MRKPLLLIIFVIIILTLVLFMIDKNNYITGYAVAECALTTDYISDCFLAEAADCSEAKLETNVTHTLGIIDTTIHSLYEIRGIESDKCVFYIEYLDYYVNVDEIEFLEGLEEYGIILDETRVTQETEIIEQEETEKLRSEYKNKHYTCKFETSDLVALLNNWKQGTSSTSDFDDGECTGTLSMSSYAKIATDTTPPVITITEVNDEDYDGTNVQSEESTNKISIVVDESSTCKASRITQDYNSMGFNCDDVSTNTKDCEVSISTSGTHNIYIACKDGSGNKNTDQNNKKVTIELTLTGIPLSPTIRVTKFDDTDYTAADYPFVTNEVNHTIKISVEPYTSDCRISDENGTYSSMTRGCEKRAITKCNYSEDLRGDDFDVSDIEKMYALFVACKDSDNNNNVITINYSVDYVPPDTKLPNITNVKSNSITNQSARIQWKTDENANSRVYYGKTNNLGLQKFSIKNVKSHSITIDKLKPLKIYYYRVKSCDTSDNCKESKKYNFTTTPTPEDEQAPEIEDLNVYKTSNTSVEITWNTDENSKCYFNYGINKTKLNTEIKKEHNFSKIYKINLSNLVYNKTYYYKIKCKDPRGNSLTTQIKDFSTVKKCYSKFECGNWSKCEGGIQIKTCKDKNNCAKDRRKEKICTVEDTSGTDDDDKDLGGTSDDEDSEDLETDYDEGEDLEIEDDEEKVSAGWIAFWFIIILIIGGFAGSVFLYRQGKVPQLAFIMDQLDPVLRKIGLSKKQKAFDMPKIDALKSYVDQMLRAGYTKDQVYHNLLKYGYRPDQIRKYF